MPEDTRLRAYLSFKGNTLKRSRVSLTVRKGGFFYKYGPVMKVMSGKYALNILYFQKYQERNNRIFPDFHVKKYFQIGTPHQERVEMKNEQKLYFFAIKKVREIYKEIDKKRNFYLNQNTLQNPEKLKNWMRKIQLDQIELVKNINRMAYPKILIHHSAKSFRELQRIMKKCKYFMRLSFEVILRHYKINIPKSKRLLYRNVEIDFKPYISDIEHKINTILKREPSPAKLDEKDLEKDLLWFNRLFADTMKAYKKKKNWNEELKVFFIEIKDFKLKTKDYKQSILHKKYPSLVQNLEILSNSYVNVLASCTANLEKMGYTSFKSKKLPKKTKSIKETIQILRKNFKNVFVFIEEQKIKEKNKEN